MSNWTHITIDPNALSPKPRPWDRLWGWRQQVWWSQVCYSISQRLRGYPAHGTLALCEGCGKALTWIAARSLYVGWMHDWRDDCGEPRARGFVFGERRA